MEIAARKTKFSPVVNRIRDSLLRFGLCGQCESCTAKPMSAIWIANMDMDLDATHEDYDVIFNHWIVWGERNQRIFKAKSSSSMELGGRISSLVTLWQAHFPIHKFHKPP